MLEDHGVFYMISKTSGLTVIRNRKQYFYNEANSRIENSISDIARANDRSIWLSSAHGNMYQISFSDSLTVERILNQNEGNFRGTKIKWISFTPDHLFVATEKGLNLISTAALKKNNPRTDYFLNENNGYPFIESVHPTAGNDGKLYGIEKLRFRDNLQISVTNEVIDDSLMIPPMLVQPILENAIHHGVKDADGTGIVIFRLFREADSLKIVIEDNGKGGIEKKSTADGKNKSLGISTIRNRLELLNTKYQSSLHQLTITELFSADHNPAFTRVKMSLEARTRNNN